MTGAVHPRSRTRPTMSGTAAAASGVLTVIRTSSEPASASSTICREVASTSVVSVLVIDWTDDRCAAAHLDAADPHADGAV